MQTESRTQPKRRGQSNILSVYDRIGEVVSVAITLLILAFYVYHQVANTEFFTSSFSNWVMFAFYGSIVLSLLPAVVRAIIGRRNPVRPLEAACNIFFAYTALLLLYVFPFNFAHFADALPVGTHFLLSWVTNYMARVVLVLAFVGMMISAGVNIVRYLTFRPSTSQG